MKCSVFAAKSQEVGSKWENKAPLMVPAFWGSTVFPFRRWKYQTEAWQLTYVQFLKDPLTDVVF